MSRSILSVDTYISGIRAGDRIVLARAITLIESARPEHQAVARAVLAGLAEGQSDAMPGLRIGITGSPGVGKSSFIEAFGMHLIEQGRRVAVLAVDPSSMLTKGSILGDKTRMGRLANELSAFIRPSPAGNTLGGVARRTRETMLLVEAAGFDRVLVETVGVGQSETAVHSMTDFFLLLLLPGAGDDLQGIKRGIVEMADLIAVNKADGDRIRLAQQAQAFYRTALHFFPPKPSGYIPQVYTCSALTGTGIPEISQAADAYREQTLASGFFFQNRQQQMLNAFQTALHEGIEQLIFGNPAVQQLLKGLEVEVKEGKMSPFEAAEKVLRKIGK